MAYAPISPNTITTMRLPLAPLTVGMLIYGTNQNSKAAVITAMVLALVLEASDFLDGIIARNYDNVTDFGKLYDPFSDAFCRYTLFLGLFAAGAADFWMILLIFYRDSSISFFRSVAATRFVVVGARPSGKIKAVVQGVGIQIAFLFIVLAQFYPEAPIQTVPWWTMLTITVVTTASFFDYFLGYFPILKEAWNNVPPKK